jgi:hypothetical protein
VSEVGIYDINKNLELSKPVAITGDTIMIELALDFKRWDITQQPQHKH